MSNAPYLDAFLDAANHYIGTVQGDSDYYELCSYAGYPGYDGAWCAVFVLGCAGRAGVLGSVITGDSWAADVLLMTADQCNGEFYEGPGCNGGVAVTPSPGDLVTFSWDADHYGTEHASHVGIVEGVENGQVITIEGNTSDGERSNICARHKRDLANKTINMYVRPDWSRVGDDVSDYPGYTGGKSSSGSKKGSNSDSSGGGYTPLYTTPRNDRHDMTLREVCYMNDSYQLTNKPTGMSISIMNYTNLLRDLYDYLNVGAGGSNGGNSNKVDTSGLAGMHGDDNIKNAVDYLLAKNYSASAACGVVGCLVLYSLCQPTYSRKLANGDYLEGIGAWEKAQIEELKKRAGYGWNTNLTGQMEYLVYDLNRNHKALVDKIKYMDLGSAKAKDAAKDFVLEYNKHYMLTKDTEDAQDNAKELYDALKFTTTNSYASGKNLVDIDGRSLSPQFTVNIPTDLNQAGIDGNYTSYSYFYNVWNSSSMQRVVADNWAYQGFPYDRGIALVGGYYCIATTPTFGSVGDVVVVSLENGDSFAAILADIKNPSDSNYCEYGHYYDNGTLNVIEWERIVTYNGEVQTKETGAGATLVDDIDLGSWAGQDVTSITNYGSYL